MADKGKVVVAMSGGVDSSVAAALLVEQGYQVTGMMLRLWSEEGREENNRCCTPDAMAQARRVAARLRIPFYAVDVREPFRDIVVGEFLSGYTAGRTPNPCIFCNRYIRWGALLQYAQELGAEAMATGHYARLERSPDGSVSLLRAIDAAKDQTYVLSSLSQEQLRLSMFPLGGYTKPQVREMAHQLHLSSANRPDSQDLCFLAGQDYREFLQRHAPQAAQPGPILDSKGNQLGSHQGVAFYTIGQRKGLGLSTDRPYYVISKRPDEHALIVGAAEELGSSQLIAGPVNWISRPAGNPFSADVKIRYKAMPMPATIEIIEDNQVRANFDTPLRDITPGQLAVFYQDDHVIGSGVILL